MKNIAIFADFKNGHLSGRSLNLILKLYKLNLGSITIYTFSSCEQYHLPKINGIELFKIDSNNEINISDKEIVSVVASNLKNRNTDLVFGIKSVMIDSFLGQIAVILDFKIKSQLIDFEMIDKKFNYYTSVFNNKAVAKYSTSRTTGIYLINSNFKSSESDLFDIISVIPTALEVRKSFYVLKSLKPVDSSISLADASIVVGAGRGMKDASNWKIIEEFAESLNAATACSKPVSDLNWRPHHEHVGQTGVKIAPDIYIACGISGAIQHLAGVNSSKVIVVINNDPESPFFKNADYGIVGDLFNIIPRLTKKIKSR